jgi:hypothetical protein
MSKEGVAALILALAAPAWAKDPAAGPVGGGLRAPEQATPRAFAFPDEGKEPLDDAAHVRNAVARFNQVRGVTDAERDAAWIRIRAAAKRFGITLSASDWRELMRPRVDPR